MFVDIKQIGKEAMVLEGLMYKELKFQIDSSAINAMAAKCVQLMLNPDIITVNWISSTKDENHKDIVLTMSREEFYEFYNLALNKYEEIILTANREL